MTRSGCWRGVGDPTPFVPGLPAEVEPAASLDGLFEAMKCCTRCDLATERTQVVIGSGPRDATVVLIGEAPGAQEDRAGAPFVGRAGQLLDRLLEASGLHRGQIFITNIVACRPPANRAPRVREVRAHSPWLEEQLRMVRPAILVTLGRIALTYFIPGARITGVHGTPRTIVRNGRSMTLLPLFHPAAALRRPELVPVLETDFAKLRDLLAGLDSRR